MKETFLNLFLNIIDVGKQFRLFPTYKKTILVQWRNKCDTKIDIGYFHFNRYNKLHINVCILYNLTVTKEF